MVVRRVDGDKSSGARVRHHTGGRAGPGAKVPGSCGRVRVGQGKAGAEAPQLMWHGNGELPGGIPWEKYGAA